MNIHEHLTENARQYWIHKQGREGFWKDRVPTRDQALWLLNGYTSPWQGHPANFGPEANADQPLGRLIAIAFEATEKEKADIAAWQAGPIERFRTQYKFK